MHKKNELILNIIKKLSKIKTIIIILVVVIILIGSYFIFFKKNVTYKFITVEKGSIAQLVSLTGNTTPIKSVSLSFGSGGNISHTYSDLGKKVQQGQLLAELNTDDLTAQLHQTEASYSIAQTSYDKLVNGSSSSELEVAKVALNNAKNSYENISAQQKISVDNALSALLNSGIEALPTVSGASVAVSPIISGTYNSTEEGDYIISTYPTGNGSYFSVSGLESGSGPVSTVPTPLGSHGLFIQFSSNSILSYNNNWIVSIPNTKSLTYLTYYNAYKTALQNRSQVIATAQGAVDTAQAGLDQKLAGARIEDLTIAKAQVAQAQANIESIEAKIKNSKIIAPIDGVITQFDAKIGQLASPNIPLVSIMSSNGYEVDAGVSETDIGKISIGDKVTMTLDAFQNETFLGSVFYIAPAETNIQGVVSYEIKIAFIKPDSRLKSGLTANIDINTETKNDVLILPQYAILQNDQGAFVETVEGKIIKQNPVILGISDQKGNVEIVSGVTPNEKVLNIGLK